MDIPFIQEHSQYSLYLLSSCNSKKKKEQTRLLSQFFNNQNIQNKPNDTWALPKIKTNNFDNGPQIINSITQLTITKINTNSTLSYF